ncbi:MULTISPECIES: hypothetical protein [Bacillus]|uniref:hypothetical protein n=1 Tax=Bacillus TaxID=1386 RepID=UPI0001A0FE15|nr:MULTISPECIES: hypothetical protein [Bacillus]EEL53003.1 hypothetical protein bcere0023_54540 [Bacillus cereus Rock4-2]KAF6698072.1 hypothetical protein HFD78_18905 [Bacillus sp. EKM501B]MEB9543669.1 hypothetical protein [Bacillus cereus]MEB9830701.1 hypothetical protein [Bacillus cereus]PFQ06657.1 hypothetical protein COK12_09465 [Bacillus cereus]
MEVIYKKGSCKRGELFDVLVSKFVEGGWKILEDESNLKNYRVVLHSKGSLGNTPMYIGLYPYAGTNVQGNDSYNIKTSRYCNGYFSIFNDWDFNQKVNISTISGTHRLNFINGESSLSSSYGVTLSTEIPIEYYYYCDLDRVVFIAIPDVVKCKQDNSGVDSSPIVHFFGIPEETYLQEKNVPSYSCVIHAGSSTSHSKSKYLICNKPAALLDTAAYEMSFSYFDGWPGPADGGAGAGPMMLTDYYLDDSQTGLRAKLGFIYSFVPNGKITRDDTIELDTEIGKQVYKPLFTSSSYYSSFPRTTLAIRIE